MKGKLYEDSSEGLYAATIRYCHLTDFMLLCQHDKSSCVILLGVKLLLPSVGGHILRRGRPAASEHSHSDPAGRCCWACFLGSQRGQ